jgi:hypothetical protein
MKKQIFTLLIAIFAILVFIIAPSTQDQAYHGFADHRTMLGIPNFMDVMTNLGFILGGIYCWMHLPANIYHRLILKILAISLWGIALGSAYYHYHPVNETLVWDRLPMTIAFMTIFNLILSFVYGQGLARRLLGPMIALGLFSIVVWVFLDSLKLYFVVQFAPMALIVFALLAFDSGDVSKRPIGLCLLFYVFAKIVEHKDAVIFNLTGEIISGHSLKHLFAALATMIIAKAFCRKKVSLKNIH